MNKLLILTDFTKTCYDSVTYGLDFCRHYGFQAEILHVEQSSSGLYVDTLERQRTIDVANLYSSKFNMRVNVVIKDGILSDVIAAEVRNGGFTLILLGTHGRQGLQSVTGSIAAKIITTQEIPVIVVQSKRFTPIRTILLPINESVEKHSAEIAKIARVTSILGAEVEVVCRNGDEDYMDFVERLFGRHLAIDIVSSAQSLPKQTIEYGDRHGADMIFGLSYEISRPQFDTMLEQLIFNLPQIPVMCC